MKTSIVPSLTLGSKQTIGRAVVILPNRSSLGLSKISFKSLFALTERQKERETKAPGYQKKKRAVRTRMEKED